MSGTATAKEIETLEETARDEPEDFDDFLDELGYRHRTKDELIKLLGAKYVPFVGHIEVVDSYGGEGQGDEYWKVFRFKDRYFRLSGYYSSWDGVSFEAAGFEEVIPEEVITIVYRTKK